MFNDPEIMKMIIYVLAGLCGVLAIAVIFLGIKKNSYYVPESFLKSLHLLNSFIFIGTYDEIKMSEKIAQPDSNRE